MSDGISPIEAANDRTGFGDDQPVRSDQRLRQILADRREALGLTRSALENAAGLTPGSIERFERGTLHLGDIDFAAMTAVLGVEVLLRERPARSAPGAAA